MEPLNVHRINQDFKASISKNKVRKKWNWYARFVLARFLLPMGRMMRPQARLLGVRSNCYVPPVCYRTRSDTLDMRTTQTRIDFHVVEVASESKKLMLLVLTHVTWIKLIQDPCNKVCHISDILQNWPQSSTTSKRIDWATRGVLTPLKNKWELWLTSMYQHRLFLLEKDARSSTTDAAKRQHPPRPHRRRHKHQGTRENNQTISRRSKYGSVTNDHWDRRWRVRIPTSLPLFLSLSESLLDTRETNPPSLNLTTATRVHLVEPQWNPAVESQAIGRALRLGQTRTVTIIRYVMERTIEEVCIPSNQSVYEWIVLCICFVVESTEYGYRYGYIEILLIRGYDDRLSNRARSWNCNSRSWRWKRVMGTGMGVRGLCWRD